MATPADPSPAPTGGPARLAAALRAAERGWPVFPIYPYSKYPAVTDWETRATRDPGQIYRWWAQVPYNVGIACRPAGIVVLDLDAAHGQRPPIPWDQLGVTHGRDVLRILAERAGQPDPSDTFSVATPPAASTGTSSPQLIASCATPPATPAQASAGASTPGPPAAQSSPPARSAGSTAVPGCTG